MRQKWDMDIGAFTVGFVFGLGKNGCFQGPLFGPAKHPQIPYRRAHLTPKNRELKTKQNPVGPSSNLKATLWVIQCYTHRGGGTLA